MPHKNFIKNDLTPLLKLAMPLALMGVIGGSAGLFQNFIAFTLFELLIGLGKTRLLTFFTVLCVSMMVFFSYILIFGKFGFPTLGIAGAGWGMTIAYWIIAIVLAAFLLTHKEYKKYFHKMFNRKKPTFLWEILRVGVPMGTMYCFEEGFFFALTLMMGSLSSQLLAANQITTQYLGILMGIVFAIAQAITVRMGHLLGAKEINS